MTANGDESAMRWFHYVSYFFGGAIFANAIPYFTNGVSGRPFPNPLASLPGQGESLAIANVGWGVFNFLVAYILICHVGEFRLRGPREMAIATLGGLLMALWLARTFGQIYGGS